MKNILTISNSRGHPWGVIIMLIWGLLLVLVIPKVVSARVTPEDIVNSKREAYEVKVANYSPYNKEKLEILAQKIVQMNKNKTDELERIMTVQALILDEYETRQNLGSSGQEKSEKIEKARYWITYAHEAVAYQAAKIYIFNLTAETNIKSDALATISLLQSELNSTRKKVINSQNILKNLLLSK